MGDGPPLVEIVFVEPSGSEMSLDERSERHGLIPKLLKMFCCRFRGLVARGVNGNRNTSGNMNSQTPRTMN